MIPARTARPRGRARRPGNAAGQETTVSPDAILADDHAKPAAEWAVSSEEAGHPLSPPAAGNAYRFEGHIDFYGHHSRAGGWFIVGWVAHPWPPGHRPVQAAALFADLSVIQCSHSLFYPRQELDGRGIGFLFFFQSVSPRMGKLVSTFVESAGTAHNIRPAQDIVPLTEPDLVTRLEGLVAGGEQGSQRHKMQTLLLGERERQPASGIVDFFGYHTLAGGWLFCGWVARGWQEGQAPEQICASFDEGDLDGEAHAVQYPRQDLQDAATGVAFFVSGAARPLGNLCSISFEADGGRAILYPAPATSRLQGINLATRLRPLLESAMPGLDRDILLGLLARQPYRGEDTLAALNPTVFLEIDEAIQSGPDGLVLMGWCLAAPNELRSIRVVCGSLVSPLNLDDCIRVDRPDVIEAFGQHGFSDPRCGFIAWLPHAAVPNSRVYIEVETTRREIGYRLIAPPRVEGIAAIKRLLSAVDVRFAAVRPAFDRVLGPAVQGLNQTLLARPASFEVIEYGMRSSNPRFSVVVPLYGRLDFVEYQFALFSTHPRCADAEFIYVLDDPPRRTEAQFLFASVFERFRIPFRAILLDRNVGYAPANNLGLAQARGTFVAFLNSDVFPGTPDWLERLSDRMTADPGIGVIGPELLFEDGSVQHRGMYFSRLAEFGNWYFGMHHGRGLRPSGGGTPETHLSITGACMLMTRALALEMDGFDETYVVGDFEDSDLCLRLAARGYRGVVDPGVQLFHLERKSQAPSGLTWRTNLTVYNAWQHDRRWGKTIAAWQGQ